VADMELSQNIGASESERTQALERFYVIRPFLEDSVPLAQIARERAVPRRTLTRWVKQYRETGLDGLIRQGRADKGERRNMPPDLKSLIEGLALSKPRRSSAAIHRHMTRVDTEHGWPV